MLIYYFSRLYFFCFVTVKEDETEKNRRGKKSEIDTFYFKNIWKKWTWEFPQRGNFIH